MAVGPILMTTALQWAIILPMILLLAGRQPQAIGRGAFLIFAVIVCDLALFIDLAIPQLDLGHWNWTGKILSFIIALGFIHAMPWSEARSLLGRGSRPPIAKLVILFLIPLAIQIAAQFYYQGKADFSLETLAFQAIAPGIAEETVFRAMLQGGLNAILLQRRAIFGVQVGWSLPIVALLFAFGHGFYIDDSWVIQADLGTLAVTLILGLVHGYLVAMTSTIWWSVALHNIFNVLGWVWQMAR